VILLLTLGDSRALAEQTVLGRPLLWHFAVASFALALSRAVMPPAEDKRREPRTAMRRLRAALGWAPHEWAERPERTATFDVRRLRNHCNFYVISFDLRTLLN
jgi:hypothetical protein